MIEDLKKTKQPEEPNRRLLKEKKKKSTKEIQQEIS